MNDIAFSAAPAVMIRANVAACLERELPEVQPQAAQLAALTILANGPSARRASFKSPVMALNGALSLFVADGGHPTYWAACDPGEVVAEFLIGAPEKTTYFVASRCHPAVFDALKDRNVFVWNVAEPITHDLLGGHCGVPCASSVTLCAFGLARMMGFKRFETWGWDGCYEGRLAHATPQAQPADRATVNIGAQHGQEYETCGTWLFEAREAKHVLHRDAIKVRIHGGGMFGAILEHHRLAKAA